MFCNFLRKNKQKEIKPKEVKPKEIKQKEIKPKEVKPKEVKPKEIKQKEIKQKEIKPKEVKPKEVKPNEVKPKEVEGDEIIIDFIGLLEICQDEDFMKEMLYETQEEYLNIINKLENTTDASEIKIHGHTLKGVAANMNTKNLTRIGSEIQNTGIVDIHILKKEVKKVEDLLESYYNSYNTILL
ncbi:unnamed protein product [Pylaiella littoralis]